MFRKILFSALLVVSIIILVWSITRGISDRAFGTVGILVGGLVFSTSMFQLFGTGEDDYEPAEIEPYECDI